MTFPYKRNNRIKSGQQLSEKGRRVRIFHAPARDLCENGQMVSRGEEFKEPRTTQAVCAERLLHLFSREVLTPEEGLE
jgi:hypothetical protein